MFCLSKIEHTLRLPPSLLSLPLSEAIKGELESLFLDKVVAKLGLCVSVYDIQSIDGGFIFPGDGASTYTVKFRLITFRPFVGEVIAARLLESTTDGLRLSLGFFDDIYVPQPLLPNPCKSEPDPVNKKQVRWIWKFDDKEYPIDGEDEINFRVLSVSYPSIPLEQEKDSKPFAPMIVTGSLDADGLGPVTWWGVMYLKRRGKKMVMTDYFAEKSLLLFAILLCSLALLRGVKANILCQIYSYLILR